MDKTCAGRILNKYIIERQIGQGAFARVYLARHEKMGGICAVKCIHKNIRYYDRLLREAAVMRELKHESIPVVYDIDEDEEELYIIEEYCRGQTLREIMEDKKAADIGRLPDIVLKLARVLGFLHSKDILYADLKPDNVIICEDNSLKLIDFGSAIEFEKAEEGNEIFGTLGYASPEMLKGRGVDLRSDIYSFGKLLERLIACYSKDDIGIRKKDEKILRALKRVEQRCTGSLKFLRYSGFDGIVRDVGRLNGQGMSNKTSALLEGKMKEGVSFRAGGKQLSGIGTICVAESMRGTGATFWSLLLADHLRESGHGALMISAGEYEEMMGKEEKEDIYIINCLDGFEEKRQVIWGCDHLICLLRADGLNTGRQRNKRLLEITDICESRKAAYNMADKPYHKEEIMPGIMKLPYLRGMGFAGGKPSYMNEEIQELLEELLGRL